MDIFWEAPALGMERPVPDTYWATTFWRGAFFLSRLVLDTNSCPADLPQSKKLVGVSAPGPSRGPSPDKVRPTALFHIPELLCCSLGSWKP